MEPVAQVESVRAQCCVVGGGPAGLMSALLLARAGVEVVVLEKHADFLRDFRGDTIHPSTLDVIAELGILDELLRRPHEELFEIHGRVAGRDVTIADFRRLDTTCPFIAIMPQWDFLDFLVEQARRYGTFRLFKQAEAVELLGDEGRVTGVRARTARGFLDVHAPLTIGADGRSSTIRRLAQLPRVDLGAPIDVLWLRLSRNDGDPRVPLGYIDRGRVFVMIRREAYWQCGLVIPKGGGEDVMRRGIAALREEIAAIAPFLADRVHELGSFDDDVHLLTVRVDRLTRWFEPGLLCIGDAAHAMSPIGGVGINLAIQDAVAAARMLAEPLRDGAPGPAALAAVQRRRSLPTRVTQAVQVVLQERVLRRALARKTWTRLPWPLRALARWPALRRIPAWIVGVGVRPEHVGAARLGATFDRRAPRLAPSRG